MTSHSLFRESTLYTPPVSYILINLYQWHIIGSNVSSLVTAMTRLFTTHHHQCAVHQLQHATHHRHKEYYIFIYIPILYWYLHHVQKLRTILVVIGKARTASFASLLKLKQTYNQITTSLLSLAPQSTSLYLWKSI
jgi:hypothetical protein